MTLTQHAPPRIRVAQAARRFGYGVAAVVNLVLLFIVHNLLDWGIPSFLTQDFEQLLPLLSISIVGSVVVNLAYMSYDDRWFKSLTQAVLAGIALFVAIRTFVIFPFDFTPYSFDWDVLARAILVFLIVALTISMIAEGVKGLRDAVRRLATPL